MYELINVKGNTYYINSPAKIGLVRLQGGTACLIDSGNDKSAGKKAKQTLESLGLTLTAIYNTHSHADHIGGNRYLKDAFGCRIYAPGIECAYTRHPILEPALLFGGNPIDELKHKFLLAEPSEAESLTDEALPSDFEIITLPGHTADMVGFRTPDGAVFLGDCLSSKETLDKYGIGYVYDIGSYLDTLEKVKGLNADIFIPSHAEPTDDIAPLADYNIAKVNEAAERIYNILKKPHTQEELLKRVFDLYGLTMTAEQYALIGSTVRSYLVYLKTTDKVGFEIKDNTMLWQAK